MQSRMGKYALDNTQTDLLLETAETACLSTISSDGYPYTVPVHFVYYDGKVYIHCSGQGHKLDNIRANGKVCFTVYDLKGYIVNENGAPCNTNTEYESVIINGIAAVVDDAPCKKAVLTEIVKKYTPQLAGRPVAEKMVSATCVIEITIQACTGKYYK